MFQNIKTYFRIFQNIKTYFRMFQNIKTYFRMFQNIKTYFRMFQNIKTELEKKTEYFGYYNKAFANEVFAVFKLLKYHGKLK